MDAPTTIDIDREVGVTITWSDGSVGRVSSLTLRRWCPCAECRGRRETGRALWSGPEPRLLDAELVGNWGLGLAWSDGHRTGIFHWDLLRELEGHDDRPL